MVKICSLLVNGVGLLLVPISPAVSLQCIFVKYTSNEMSDSVALKVSLKVVERVCRVADGGASTDAPVTCYGEADIVFALDQSGSIDDGEWSHFVNFTQHVAGAFPIGRNLTQVGLLKFSSDVDTIFHLDTYGDRQSVLRAIGELDNDGGGTNIAVALRSARVDMFSVSNGARPGVPKILILLTDGQGGDNQAEADRTKAAGITVSILTYEFVAHLPLSLSLPAKEF